MYTRGLRILVDKVKSGGSQFVSLSRIETIRWKIGAVELEPRIFPVLSLLAFLRVQIHRDSQGREAGKRDCSLILYLFLLPCFSPSSPQPGGGAASLGEVAN